MGQIQSMAQDWASACYERVRPTPAKVHIVSEDEGAAPTTRPRASITPTTASAARRVVTKATSDTEKSASGTTTPQVIKR
jgi:hypothetical protein